MYSLILHGRRLVNLQKWRPLSVSVQNTPVSFSSAAASDVSPQVGEKGKNFSVSYLVGSLGLPTKLAGSISRKVSFKEKGNPDSVLNLLRSHGFTDSQISGMIRDYPLLLVADAEKSLGPKLKFLQSRGASTSELTEIVSKVPKILGKKGENTISRYYDFVHEIIEADKSSEDRELCHSLQQGIPQENIIRNVLALRKLGVPQHLLFSLLMSDNQFICGKEKFEESLKKVVEMGFDPATPKFIEALGIFYRMSDKAIEERVNGYIRLCLGEDDVWVIFKKWPSFLKYSEKKITQTFETLKSCGLLEHEVLAVLKKHPRCICVSEQKILNSVETFIELGFSRDEFAMMVKRYPQCLDYTAETVKKKTEFIVKKMNWPLKALVLTPQVFGYSLDKRTVPRYEVINALMSKGLLQDGSHMSRKSALTSTDLTFVKRYVMKHGELVPELLTIFNGNHVS